MNKYVTQCVRRRCVLLKSSIKSGNSGGQGGGGELCNLSRMVRVWIIKMGTSEQILEGGKEFICLADIWGNSVLE